MNLRDLKNRINKAQLAEVKYEHVTFHYKKPTHLDVARLAATASENKDFNLQIELFLASILGYSGLLVKDVLSKEEQQGLDEAALNEEIKVYDKEMVDAYFTQNKNAFNIIFGEVLVAIAAHITKEEEQKKTL